MKKFPVFIVTFLFATVLYGTDPSLEVPSEVLLAVEAEGGLTLEDETEVENPPDSSLFTSYKAYLRKWIPSGWEGNFSFGFSHKKTSSKKLEINLGIDASKKIKRNTYEVSTFYQYCRETSSAGVTSNTMDEYGVGFGYQYDLSNRWYLSADSTYLKDSLKEIRHQLQEVVTTNYKIWNTKKVTFSVGAGPAIRYTDAVGLEDKWNCLAAFKDELTYLISGTFRLEHSGLYLIDPQDSSKYSIKYEVAFVVDLTNWLEASLCYTNQIDTIQGKYGEKDEEKLLFGLAIPF